MLSKKINYPQNWYKIYSPSSLVANVALKWGNLFTRKDFVEEYKVMYKIGVYYDRLSKDTLSYAKEFLQNGDIVNAKKFYNKYFRLQLQSKNSFGSADVYYCGNIEGGM